MKVGASAGSFSGLPDGLFGGLSSEDSQDLDLGSVHGRYPSALGLALVDDSGDRVTFTPRRKPVGIVVAHP